MDYLVEAFDAERKANNEYIAVLLQKMKALEAAAPKWISVEERLPEEDGMSVLCAVKTYWGTCVCGGHYSKTSNRVWPEDEDLALDEVTHWMPLPEPPKEEGEERVERI